jgi:hypothetical protein
MKHKFWVALMSAFALIAIVTACQKEDEVSNDQIVFRAPPPPCTSANPAWTTAGSLCAGEDFTVTFCVSATCGLLQLQRDSSGVWVKATANELPTDGCISYTMTAAAAGSYKFRAQYNGNAGGCDQNFCNVGFNDAVANTTVTVVPCGCTIDGNTFTVSGLNLCGSTTHTATYTVCSEDGLGFVHVQGGLTNFTGGDATVTVSGCTGIPSITQRTPGSSSNRIVEVECGVSACSCMVITMSWTSTNTNGEVTGGWSVSGDYSASLLPQVCAPN